MCSNWLNAATNLSGLETLSGQTPASILRTAIKALQQSARSGTPLETNQTALVTLGEAVYRLCTLLPTDTLEDANVDNVVLALQLLEGINLFHLPLRLLLAKPRFMQKLVYYLACPHTHIALQVIQTLSSAIVGFPPCLRSFEKSRGLFAVHREFSSPQKPPVVRMKCIEFLALYLSSEPECHLDLCEPWMTVLLGQPSVGITRKSPESKFATLTEIFGKQVAHRLSMSLASQG